MRQSFRKCSQSAQSDPEFRMQKTFRRCWLSPDEKFVTASLSTIAVEDWHGCLNSKMVVDGLAERFAECSTETAHSSTTSSRAETTLRMCSTSQLAKVQGIDRNRAG